jgi:hypothetical protein
MSDFESRLKELEDAREVQDRVIADLRKGQAELFKGQEELFKGQAEIREKVAAINTMIPELIQGELQLAWRAISCELQNMLTVEQMIRVHEVAMRCYVATTC